MNALCLLTNALIRVQSTSGQAARLSLPEVLAQLSSGEVLDFPWLRPHQQPAWHAFLVQLAFLALEHDGRLEVPAEPATWQKLLRGLTPGYLQDEPWCLVVDNWQQPAFLQSPCLPGAQTDYKRILGSAQEVDLLITSKNHDEKVGKMSRLGCEDADLMIFALVSLQGFAGYLGAGNFNTMRMNGGFASRAQFRLAFERGSGPEFLRDLRVLLSQSESLWDDADKSGIGTTSGSLHQLLWLVPWADQALALQSVHPLCLEVCRRIRLRWAGEKLQALTAGSKSARVDAKLRNGVVLDPWLPLVKEGAVRAFTATSNSFSYRSLSPILFDGQRYQLPLLAVPRADESSAGVLVAQVLVGGSGRTEGLLRREIPMRSRTLRKFSDARGELALRAQRFIEIASALQGKVLRAALLQFIDGSDEPDWTNSDFAKYVSRWMTAFDQQVDSVFYEALFDTIEAELADQPSEVKWLQVLLPLARATFERTADALPSRDRSRLVARARAEQLFRSSLIKQFSPLLPRQAASGTAAADEADAVPAPLESSHAPTH